MVFDGLFDHETESEASQFRFYDFDHHLTWKDLPGTKVVSLKMFCTPYGNFRLGIHTKSDLCRMQLIHKDLPVRKLKS